MKTRASQGMIGEAFILALFVLLFAAPAFATGGNDNDCDHPRFLEKGCGYEGADGRDGKDGKDGHDGADGRDGKDGKDGRDGVDGKDGRDGKDGVVDETWIQETRIWQSKWNNYSAAMDAIQIHLPQDRNSRLTGGIARIHGQSGFGLGYAYMFDNDRNLAVTVGVGTSGGEQVGKASVGFEFGGSRSKFDPNANKVLLLQQQLRDHEEKTLALCRKSNERVHEACVRK